MLEIGTGCGYQSAVLSRVAKEVYSVERIAQLVAKARTHLRELRIHNVKIKYGDGAGGFADVAPFDAIVMSAGATHIPQLLLEMDLNLMPEIQIFILGKYYEGKL